MQKINNNGLEEIETLKEQLNKIMASILNNEDNRERLLIAKNNIESEILSNIQDEVTYINIVIESEYEKKDELEKQLSNIETKILALY